MKQEILAIIKEYWYFSIVFFLLNIVILYPLSVKILFYFNRRTLEGLGNRRNRKSVARNLQARFRKFVSKYDKGEIYSSYYNTIKAKLRKSGYRNIYAPIYYMLLKYLMPVAAFFIVLPVNYPDIIRPLILSGFLFAAVEIVVYSKKKDLNMRFRRYIYKIFRYLHNQISSGVSVADAIKTVYRVVHDKQIQYTLIELAARFELTSDIDYALEIFNEYFDCEEVDTLCLAIKQGIETGDNKDLLIRQEGFMFSKYFSYIQAETDRANLKSLAAAFLFVLILVIMVSVPLLQEGAEGLSNIFVN